MEKNDLNQKLIIRHWTHTSKSEELLNILSSVSDSDIDNFCETEKDKLADIEKQLKVDRIVNSLKRRLKIEENVDMLWIKWTKVSAVVRWTHYNYFIPNEDYCFSWLDKKSLIENNSYYASEIEKLMVNIVKFLLSFSWIEKSDIFPWSIYVESVKKLLKLDKWFWMANYDKNNGWFYGVNLINWWFTFQEYNKASNPRLLLKIKD